MGRITAPPPVETTSRCIKDSFRSTSVCRAEANYLHFSSNNSKAGKITKQINKKKKSIYKMNNKNK